MRGCGALGRFHALTLLLGVCVGGCANWTDRGTSLTDGKTPLIPVRENLKTAALEFDFYPISLVEPAKVDDVAEEASAHDATSGEISSPGEESSREQNKTLPVTWASSPVDQDSEFEESRRQSIQQLWQWVDETGIDTSLRRRLSENGLRLGYVMDQEKFLRHLSTLSPKLDNVEEFLKQADVSSEMTLGRQRIPMRMGRRYELPVRDPIQGSHVSLVRMKGETVGQTLIDPQFLFAVTAAAGRDSGELRLRLRPEIQHGAMKQTWVERDSALRIDTRRSVWSLEDLDIELVGHQNDLFVLAAHDAEVGLGRQMFRGTMSDGTPQQTVMLVRIAHVPTAIDRL